jgi:hypothetical protein
VHPGVRGKVGRAPTTADLARRKPKCGYRELVAGGAGEEAEGDMGHAAWIAPVLMRRLRTVVFRTTGCRGGVQAAARRTFVPRTRHTLCPDRTLTDPRPLLYSIEEAGIAARVINTPTAFLEDADGNIPTGMIPWINDARREPGEIGLAKVVVA